MVLLLTILAGAVSYASVQFLWYAPFVFGPAYLSGTARSEDDAVEAVAKPGSKAPFIFGIIIPALLTSAALVALKTVTDRMFLANGGFLLFALALGLSISLPKYLVAFFSGRRPERLVLIQDGALLFGLLGAAFAIVGSTIR